MTLKSTITPLILICATLCWGYPNNRKTYQGTKEVTFSSSDTKLVETFERSQKWHSPTPTMATIPLVIGTKRLYLDVMLFVCVMPPTNALQPKC